MMSLEHNKFGVKLVFVLKVTADLDIEPNNIVDIIANNGMTKSKSEARRMIKQAAVRIDNEKILDMELIVHPGKEVIIKVGKRKFLRVK